MSLTASRGVQCSPASSLFSSLKRRTSSSKIVPIAWLSRPGCFTEPSPFKTGFGLRLIDGIEELLDQRAERIGLRQPRDLIAELEVVEDVLDVRREAVEVGLEVGLELLLAGAVSQIAQRELRGVVERLAGRLAERLRPGWRCSALSSDVLHVEHGLLGRLEHRVEAAQDRHRQDDVAVLAAHVQVAQDVVGDAPDEIRDPRIVAVHCRFALAVRRWLCRPWWPDVAPG